MKRLSSLFALVVLVPAMRANDDAAELAAYDAKVLKDAGIGSTAPELLAFFKARTLTNDDLLRVPKLIRQLGNNDFDERDAAAKSLTGYGTPVLPLIRPAVNDPDAEIARLARAVITDIEASRNLGLPMAAARLLARSKADGAVAVLVNYLPFADDEFVTAEVLDALAALGAKTKKADPVLVAALNDPLAAKRAGAGFVLGRRNEPELREKAHKLLADRDAHVRFRTAQGLLAGLDKAAVPTLIDFAAERSGELGWQAEDVLIRLAGEYLKDLKYGDTEDDRKARHEAWSAWWKANEAKVDLAKAAGARRFLNHTLVPEMHANKVWEIGSDGKTILWEVAVPGCPIDAEVLPGGRILVAELNAHIVTERDQRTGKIEWEYKINTPIACRRLPNGQTFIGTNHSLHVVTREGKEVMTYKPTDNFFIHSVQRLDNGHMVCVSMEGAVREVDPTGKELVTIPLPIRGSWSGVESAPGGHFLAVNNAEGKVLEVDRAGKIVWEYLMPGACYASRLPNGNTLVVSNNTGLYEVDRGKKIVWEHKIGTSLWRAHRR
jgi:HEAT repeat protein